MKLDIEMEIRQLGDTWILSVDEMNRVVSLLEVESQRLNREKQATIDKLTKALSKMEKKIEAPISNSLKIRIVKEILEELKQERE